MVAPETRYDLPATLELTISECSVPCNSLDTICQIGVCEGGDCTAAAREPRPSGCCSTDNDCNSSQEPCLLGQCDASSNQCIYRTICSASAYFDPDVTCTSDTQCSGISSTCAPAKCIGGTCIIGSVPSDDPSCCNHPEDCVSVPCTSKFCDVAAHTCFYRHEAGCTITEEESYSYESESPSSDASSLRLAVPGLVLAFAAMHILAQG